MKIKLAKYAGFCMGVRRALALCMEMVRNKKIPLYTFGPLIHNNTVIDELESLGVKSINDTSQIGKGSHVLIRSHGITPQLRRELAGIGAHLCDATCPKVAKVQGIIRDHVARGHFIVIIGDHGHAETKGLLGYSEGKGQILSTPCEVEEFVSKKDRDLSVCVVAQTTQEIEVFDELCLHLKNYFSNLKIINTICDATRRRQEEIRNYSKDRDSIFVAGGKHSANTTRLFEIARKFCSKVYHIERASEIDSGKVSNKERIFITAGASTPLWIIYEIKERLQGRNFASRLLNIMGSRYIYWIVAAASFFLSVALAGTPTETIILIFLASILASQGFFSYYLKRMDVFRMNYFYGKTMFFVGLTLLLVMSLFYSTRLLFLVFYYGMIFYMIYKNVAVGRNLAFTLCNAAFLVILLIVFL